MKKGAYQLLIHLDRDVTIGVGRLGKFRFPAGYYVYTGSAMSGIEARIRRHLSTNKKLRWHIDYLLEHARVIGYAIKESAEREECAVNAQAVAMPGARVLIRGFGCSDCRCASHLIYFESKPYPGLSICSMEFEN
jgi:Uri superfamily endonuclease